MLDFGIGTGFSEPNAGLHIETFLNKCNMNVGRLSGK